MVWCGVCCKCVCVCVVSVCLCMCVCFFVCFFVCLFVCFVCLFVCLFVFLLVSVSVSADARAGRGPFPKPMPTIIPMVRFGLPKPPWHGYLHNAGSDLMHHQYRLSVLQWNPGPARMNSTKIIAATCCAVADAQKLIRKRHSSHETLLLYTSLRIM